MKILIQKIGFLPKENESDIYFKKYGPYLIEVDLRNETINYGGKIIFNDTKNTIQNITKSEDWVVLECVNRLLEKGYKPEDIILEKIYPSGHGTSGRLDILVKKEGKAFLMIECKTWGSEFEKEFKKLKKDGGQLFTYFQQDRDAEYLALYTSQLEKDVEYRNEIVNIEESYRETSNVNDFYERWNKFTKTNGVFDEWVNAYEFQSKTLTLADLKNIKQEDSSFIFNRFLEILRHNVVSDKPNAFNKIFTLFLCKIKDEDKRNSEELEFQWIEGIDDHISFQKRLTDLYRKGMKEFLEKEVTDFSDADFNREFGDLDEKTRVKILEQLTKIRLQKNNEFAIKEVFDEETFIENGKVLKEVVELLQEYKFRYNKKQPFLGDFFELLLTTGLKQESGQFFTPVPIARFICKSVPIKNILERKLKEGATDELLPNLIDYAAGSGHFLTESMEEIQNIIEEIPTDKLAPSVQREMDMWKVKPFDWAYKYIFGVELDYRLVKTSKVGCYLHGDGIANVIHGDGLANFGNKTYRGKLYNKSDGMDNPQFDFVLSNPPYAVSSFKGNIKNEHAKDDFELFDKLTDQSSEIECLFIERTKQLLKEGGIAAIILPSSILSNAGIYTKTREILLKYFKFIGITELGSSTFMATGTNTVILFLRRRNNFDWQNIESAINQYFQNFRDVTVLGTEKAFSKYVAHAWEGISYDDYISILKNKPTESAQGHEIYKDYNNKIKIKNVTDIHERIIEIEKEKLLYFILTYSQKIVLVKTGEKNEEKKFLGYEFSNRRGSEGIHPIQRGKMIDECTRLFDAKNQYNPEKASTYILEAFEQKEEIEISPHLKENISRHNLVDMLTFDVVNFEKSISLSVKKKIKIESKWEIVKIGEIATTQYGFTEKAEDKGQVRYLRITDLNNNGTIKQDNAKVFINPSMDIQRQFLLKNNDIVIARSGSVGKSAIYRSDQYEKMIFASYLIRLNSNLSRVLPQYLFYFTQTEYYWDQVEANSITVSQPNLNAEKIKSFKIPLPPKNIQEKIVNEIEILERKDEKMKKEVENLKETIKNIYFSSKTDFSETVLSREINIIGGGTPKTGNPEYWNGNIPWLSVVDLRGENRFVEKTEKRITELGFKNSST